MTPQTQDVDVAASTASQPPQSATGVEPRWLRRVVRTPEFGVGAGLLLIVFIFSVWHPEQFPTSSNIRNIILDASSLTVLAVCATFLLISRTIDLSIGGVIACSEIVLAKVITEQEGWGIVVIGLGIAILVGGFWGLLNALVVTKLRVPAFVATLATLGMAQGSAFVIGEGRNTAAVPLTLVNGIGAARLGWMPIPAIIALVVVIVATIYLRFTRFGRYTYATGSDPTAAARSGIRVDRHRATLFGIAGSGYGFVAFLNVARFSSSSVTAHEADALNAITAVVLGGTSLFGGVGTAIGTLIGVFIPSVLRNGLIIAGIQPYWQEILVGAALAGAVGLDQHRRRTSSS